MSQHTIHTPFQTGDFISARAARRVTAHPRATAVPEPALAGAGPVSPVPVPDKTSPSPASGPRILRRWSVAELIARAAAGPPVVA